MKIQHNAEMVKKFSEIMLKEYYSQSVTGRTGLHRSDAICCPLKAFWRITKKIEAKYSSQDVGMLLLGTLAHIALHKNFEAQEKVFTIADQLYVTVDALYGKYPIETKTCYDDQTEVLTENGWKYFKDLTNSDLVLTMNPQTKEGIFVKPLELIKQKYCGKMFKYESQSLGIAVTPNHQMLIKRRNWREKDYNPKYIWKTKHKNYDIPELTPCNELIGKNIWVGVPKTFKWFGIENVKLPFNLSLTPFLQFLGWFIAEGYINRYDVAISQKELAYHQDIEQILNNLGLKWTFSGDKYHIWNKDLAEYLKQICYYGDKIRCKSIYCCYNKIVPKFVKKLSSQKIKLFLDEYWKGDGSYNGYGEKKRVFHTTSKQLADDIQELILKCNGYATITKKPYHESNYNGRLIKPKTQGWIISEWLKNKEAWVNPIKGKLEDYNGNVYCAIVEPYHILLVRRNNKPFWCGNTRKKVYRKEDLPQSWLEQLAIAISVMNVDTGYLMVLNIINYSLTVWEITMTEEEREMFLQNCIWQILSILDAIQKLKPEILTPKIDECKWCPYRPMRVREGCPFYVKPREE